MDTNNAQVILDAGASLVDPVRDHGGIPYVALPDGYSVNDLENLLPQPSRKRAKVVMLDSPSFIAYAKKHGSLDNCTLYADVDYDSSKCSIVAVVNDHGSDVDQAQWRDHTATFQPKLSHEWKCWTQLNKQAQDQAKFAAFIEDNMGDIASIDGMPTATDMLQMALAFEANSDKRFKKRIDLQSGGAALEYVDQQDESTSAKMRFFERFTIGIPVFQGSTAAYPIEARLKYRQQSDKLVFWFELIRPDRVFKQAVTDEIEKIHEATGFMLLYGNAGL